MPASQESADELKIASVLFTDIVAYSRQEMERQRDMISQLKQAVRESPAIQRAASAGDLIQLPTGDGIALVFFHDPTASAQGAIEISQAVRNAGLQLRIGVHTGPVYCVTDINENVNVSGGGINIAQRVMDCGDAGHILLSGTTAEILSQLAKWRPYLRDLGDCEVKHGLRLRLFNLCTPEAGNSSTPNKLNSAAPSQQEAKTRSVKGRTAISPTRKNKDSQSRVSWALTPMWICCSEKDGQWVDELRATLLSFMPNSEINIWNDREIETGQSGQEQINRLASEAKVVLLMVSPYFLSSGFCTRLRLPAILAESRRAAFNVLWVPVHASIYEAEILQYPSAIDPRQPLAEMPPIKRKRALVEICSNIQDYVQIGAFSESRSPAHALALPKPSSPVTLEVSYRQQTEMQGGDALLPAAAEARFIALTYKTLGLALTEGNLRLPMLADVELGVYALPILRKWHPTVRNYDRLKNEWKDGITQVLNALTDISRCPKIQKLDLRLINRVPTFTASVLNGLRTNAVPTMSIRYTPVLEEEEPASTPTLSLTLNATASDSDPVFAAYARIVDNMRIRGKALVYPILRKGESTYLRTDVDNFVSRLTSVTNHPDYVLPDAEFQVYASISDEVVQGARLNPKFFRTGEVGPEVVYSCFDFLRQSGKTEHFRLQVDYEKHEAILKVGPPAAERWIDVGVKGRHKIGVFALLTKGSGPERAVALKRKDKPPWPFDVPGGKVAAIDRSMADAVVRELFEELGLLFDPTDLAEAISVKYDKHSRREGVPVIAAYCKHELVESEMAYLADFLPPDAEGAKGQSLEFVSIEELVAKKRARRRQNNTTEMLDLEAECHAPLEAILQLRSRAMGIARA